MLCQIISASLRSGIASTQSRSILTLWTPADLGSDLALWLDADDSSTVTLNGSTVSQWSDKSGNDRHFSQPTAVSQPVYGATNFVGKPGLSFSPSQRLFRESAFMYDLGGLSMFSAMRPAPSGLNQFTLSESNNANNVPFYSILTTKQTGDLNDQSMWLRMDSGASFNDQVLFDDGLMASDRIVGLVDSGTQVTAFNNGATGTMFSYAIRSSGPITLNRTVINGLIRPLGTLGMNVSFGEIVIAAGALSTTDRQKLEGYLAWKWGGI